MNTLQTGILPLFDPAVTRALLPVQPVAEPKDAPRQPVIQPRAVPPLLANQRGRLEDRADQLQQSVTSDESTTPRNRQAISAYQSLSNIDERETVSQLLGVDEYA